MSLDGFITGPNVGVGNGMGDDGDRLHDWKFGAKTETDAAIVDEIYESTGAVLIGKRMFDVGFEPWGDPPPFGMPVMQIHLTPVLLGDGIRLFEDLGPDRMELRKTSSIETPSATHFRFEVVK
jgi:dihydrofolate reductase